MRSLTTAAVAASLLAIASVSMAFAHAELESSSPADGATLTDAPGEVRLVFGGELDPDGTGFSVTDEDGAVVGDGTLDLSVADRNELSGAVDITEGGTYTVSWTATSLDGHAEEGVVTFGVALDAGGAPPDTAVPTTSATSALLGLLLLAAALMLARRRSIRAEADR